ncbi:MAG: hypothetical protein FJ197_03690 [Gammaproteobacteria bacterium]|nr:hypothetical protein [Gammaproteobacteria bacterium]
MRRTCLFALLALVALSAPAWADTLIIEEMQSARATASERPGRGLSMAQVTSRWGEPAARDAAVGQPPITRWSYPGFIVFFEYDHVVHAVVRKP